MNLNNRWDETWHRLREWTAGQTPSERLAAQVVLSQEYQNFDPSHPLGGKDGGKDALCTKDGIKWAMAVYFPRGQKTFPRIREKFIKDVAGVIANKAEGIIFVTNQEIKGSQRKILETLAGSLRLDLFHLDRVTTILDTPGMAEVRRQYLSIDYGESEITQELTSVKNMLADVQNTQTGGDSFCYWMLFHFDMIANIAQQYCIIRVGRYVLHDVRYRIIDRMSLQTVVPDTNWGEINSPADYLSLKWPLSESAYYRVFFHARNGSWVQDLILKRSKTVDCWLHATRVKRGLGETPLEEVNELFISEFGIPEWLD